MADDNQSISVTIVQLKPKRLIRHTKPCKEPGCDKWAWAQGYCDPHYQKLKKEGVLKNVRIVGDLNARFDASYKVNPLSGCWEWTGWIHPKGYGILGVGGRSKKVRAHRFAYERFVGPIPKGVLVLHSCDVRKCCNYKHLHLGDNFKNMQECVARGRHGALTGTIYRKITPAMALNIRIMYARSPKVMQNRFAQGQHSIQQLAEIYSVTPQTISDIVRGRSHLAV